MYCTRPGGGYEGSEVMTTNEGLFFLRDLPKRPNGESVHLPPRHRGNAPYHSQFEERPTGSEVPKRVWPETPEDKERKQILKLIEQARRDLIARVSISSNSKEVLATLAKRTDDFTEKAEVQKIFEAMLIQERVEEMQREANERRNIEILRLVHEERQELNFTRDDE